MGQEKRDKLEGMWLSIKTAPPPPNPKKEQALGSSLDSSFPIGHELPHSTSDKYSLKGAVAQFPCPYYM